MSAKVIERPVRATPVSLNRLRTDLARCVDSADHLGLTAIAIYLQRAADELHNLEG